MTDTAAHPLDDLALAVVGRAEGDVSTLGGEGAPFALVRDEAGDAEAGAGADDADGGACLGRAAPHLLGLAGPEARDRHGHRGEVVDHHEAVEPEAPALLLDGEGPGMIGEVDAVAGDRRGDGEGGDPRRHRGIHLVEIGAGGLRQPGVVGAVQHLDARDRPRALEGEAGVGAADVRQQPRGRPVVGHGASPG